MAGEWSEALLVSYVRMTWKVQLGEPCHIVWRWETSDWEADSHPMQVVVVAVAGFVVNRCNNDLARLVASD